jgi:hypothetical protein
MEQRSRKCLAGLSFEDDIDRAHNWDTMLSTALDNRRAGAAKLFMDSADGGWDRPVPAAMAEGSKRTKKAELDLKPAAKAGADHRAAAHGPAREMRAERGGAAGEERATHTSVAAIDSAIDRSIAATLVDRSLRHFDQQRASMSLLSTDASKRQSAVPMLLSLVSSNESKAPNSCRGSSPPLTPKALQPKPAAPRKSNVCQRSGVYSSGDDSQGDDRQDLDHFHILGIASPRISPLGKGGPPGPKKGFISPSLVNGAVRDSQPSPNCCVNVR